MQIVEEHAWQLGKNGAGTNFCITDEVVVTVLKVHENVSGTIRDCYKEKDSFFYTVEWDCGCIIEAPEDLLEEM